MWRSSIANLEHVRQRQPRGSGRKRREEHKASGSQVGNKTQLDVDPEGTVGPLSGGLAGGRRRGSRCGQRLCRCVRAATGSCPPRSGVHRQNRLSKVVYEVTLSMRDVCQDQGFVDVRCACASLRSCHKVVVRLEVDLLAAQMAAEPPPPMYASLVQSLEHGVAVPAVKR